jgi:L-iditol 2-dehydrogenase
MEDSMGEICRAGVITAPGQLEIREVPRPEPQPGEVLVRIDACAICTTEQRIYSGVQSWSRFPYVGGHEAVGRVTAIGPGTEVDLTAGDRVAIFSATCGQCVNCRRGRTGKCLHREGFWEHAGLWGTWGFADYKAVKPRGLQPIAADVPIAHAALAEPLSCVIHGCRVAGARLGDHAVVIGAGAMGLLNTLVLRALGVRVTVLDLEQPRCERALAAGATYAFVPDDDVASRIRGLGPDRGPDLVVVAASAPGAYDLGRALLGPLSRLVAFSSVHPRGEKAIDYTAIHRDEVALVGAVSSDLEDMAVVGEVISHRLVDLASVIDCVMPFDRLADAMERAVQPDAYRVVLQMEN